MVSSGLTLSKGGKVMLMQCLANMAVSKENHVSFDNLGTSISYLKNTNNFLLDIVECKFVFF